MTTEIDKALKEMETLMEAPEATVSPDGITMEEWTFTNDKANPAIRHLFHMFYESAFRNKLGLMHARDKSDGKVKTIIVGVEVGEDGQVMTWPIAKVLTEEEQGNFEAPDGNGGYIQG